MASENDKPQSEAADEKEGQEPTILSGRSESPTMASSPADDDHTIASSPESHEMQPDRTVASPVTEAKESEKPTKVSPEPGKTQGDKDTSKTTVSDSSEDRILQGRYQIKKTLGKGGFGAAYLAEDIRLKRGCVVKQMLIPRGISSQQLQLYQANFEREASLLAQLNEPGHPNIPDIYDYFSDDTGNYLVMKYIEGQSLKGVIDHNDNGIPWREAVRYIIDMSDALNYMHTHGDEPVMHRDIKPDNILLGNDNRVWLVDFGLAKADPVAGSGDVNMSMAAGSLGYTPLEQWSGKAVPASDSYALGATLHHLVTGVSPSRAYGGEFNPLRIKQLHGVFKPIREINQELPKALEEVVARATAAEPDERLTALQIKEQLEALISGAQAAALYTFKSGDSAKTVLELVDLCEKYDKEAMAYLDQGDFQRWFRMINRNDLADAAEQAVKQGKNQKDALQRFLKLLVPNLAMRRLRRATWRLARAAIILVLIVIGTVAVLGVGGSYVASNLIRQSIGTYGWNFNRLDLEAHNQLSEAELNNNAQALVGIYVDNIQLDMQPPNLVDVNGSWSGIPFNIPVTLQLENGKPTVNLTKLNGIPLPFIADNISQGINAGIDEAFQNSPVDFASLTVDDETITVTVEESAQSGRPALPTATPLPTVTPTATPIPTETPTPEGLALVTIFNETGRDIILDLEGEIIEMAADDSKAIETVPGTYNYTVTFKDTGGLAAEGEKEWTVQTYIWRIRE